MSIVILLVLVAVLWIVVLAPGVVRRFSEREGSGSIDHFHHQLQLLEHAGPKLVDPAYRLGTARSGTAGPLPSIEAGSSRPRLVLLRPVDDGQSADIDGVDGARYERVGIIERPEPPVSPAQTHAGLAAYRRQQARQRCTVVLRVLTGLAITTGVLGMLPSFRLAWFFTAITAIAAFALVGLIAYAREIEGQRRTSRRPPFAARDQANLPTGAAEAGHPGAWDEQYNMPLRRAAGR